MSKNMFESSKAALAFAAVTIVGAVSMVGTSDDRGLLAILADRFGNRPNYETSPSAEQVRSEAPPEVKQPSAPQSDWYAPPTPVFGSYGDTSTDGSDTSGNTTSSRPSSAQPAVNPMTAPVSPTAIVIKN